MAGRVERIEEWVQEGLRWENWESLMRHAAQFAARQLKKRRWRGKKGGTLPEGYDANGVAAEVVAGMLAGKCRLALGWTRQRLEAEIQRRIENEVRRLSALKEAEGMRGEWDILPLDSEGKPQSAFKSMVSASVDPSEEAAENEEEAERLRAKLELLRWLDGDMMAAAVFVSLCRGGMKRREIAQKLGVTVQAVTAGRKRMERRLAGIGDLTGRARELKDQILMGKTTKARQGKKTRRMKN